MGMLKTLLMKTVAPTGYARITNELAATVVRKARASLIDEGKASPTQSEINGRAHQLYLVGAREFRHGTVQRMDVHKAIERLTSIVGQA
jgi:hypothetical protein